jgi:hypothetical protein
MIGKVELRRSSRHRSRLGLRLRLRTCRRNDGWAYCYMYAYGHRWIWRVGKILRSLRLCLLTWVMLRVGKLLYGVATHLWLVSGKASVWRGYALVAREWESFCMAAAIGYAYAHGCTLWLVSGNASLWLRLLDMPMHMDAPCDSWVGKFSVWQLPLATCTDECCKWENHALPKRLLWLRLRLWMNVESKGNVNFERKYEICVHEFVNR